MAIKGTLKEPVLIIFGGLPGTGKTTISKALSRKVGAFYLRIDAIETAISNSALNLKQAENAGYLAAYELAKENLRLGHSVIGDSVNPAPITREAWKACATSVERTFLEVEVICSDEEEHQRRLDARNVNIEETTPLVTWKEVQKREYHHWNNADLRLDTFKLTLDECIEKILDCLS